MYLIDLIKSSFKESIDPKLISSIGVYFLILQLIPSILLVFDSDNFWLKQIDVLGYCFLIPLIINALEAREKGLARSITSFKTNLIKFWKVVVVSLLSGLFIFLGTIAFIVPGILLAKRYQYVWLFASQEMLGPRQAMKKSSELSTRKGWIVFLSNILICLIGGFISSFSIFYGSNSFPISLISILIGLWVGQITLLNLLYKAKSQLSL